MNSPLFQDFNERSKEVSQYFISLKNLEQESIKLRNDIHLSITAISIDIITVGFDNQDLFSGNIDARKIKDTAIEYGFSYSTDTRKTSNGFDLLSVKANRNDLAHGFKSFTEVGRDKTADELLVIKSKVI